MSRRAQRPLQPVPRFALTKREAAESLGVSINHFERHVQPYLRVVICGQLILIPPDEIERFVRDRRGLLMRTGDEQAA